MEGTNTTLYFWRREKNQEILMCFCVFWKRNMVRKERKKNAQKSPNSSQKPNFSVLVQSRALRAIYSPWHAFHGKVHLVGPPGQADTPTRCAKSSLVDVSNFVLMHFLVPNSNVHLEVFSDSN